MSWRILPLLLLLLTVHGCSSLPSNPLSSAPAELKVVENVPFRAQQSRDDCGPAALGSLLAHRGRELPIAAITAAVYHPALGGSLLPDLENFARAQGFATRSGRGELALLRREIEAGNPVLIPLQLGSWGISRPHYVVVFGYAGDRFLAHVGTREKVWLAGADLLARWERMGRLYLLLE